MQYKKPELFVEIENFINGYVDTYGTSPTVRDIAAGTGISKSSVASYLAAMEDNGMITYDSHRKVITRQMQSDMENYTRTPCGRVGVPIVGTVGCSDPRDAEEYIEETVKLPKAIFGNGPLFILLASGDSMIEAGIEDGDLVVVQQQDYAYPGQIVVALIDHQQTTLKGYFPEPEKRRIRLQPANSQMEPMYFREIEIQGVAVKVIKDVGTM